MPDERRSGQKPPWLGQTDGGFCQAIVDCLSVHPHTCSLAIDPEGRIVACNDAMARLLGLNSRNLQDALIWDKLVDADAARLRERSQPSPAGGGPFLLNFALQGNAPATFECSLASMTCGHFVILAVPAHDSAGESETAWLELNNAFATLSRENARKSRQLELKNSELVRTADELKRSNQALAEARTAALGAAEAKAEFLRHMSHELRTPMNGVMGMIQLLLTTDLSPEQQRYATISQTSGRALLALIDNILDLARIEAHAVVLENVGFNLRQTVEDVVQLLSVLAATKGLRIDSQVSGEIPRLLCGDPNRLRQVLTNLSGNAIKFTERGGVRLSAALAGHEDGKAVVRFAVTDTGIGIPPDRAAALFSPFTQADASTSRKYGGTGLGLAISKQLVEMMGGQIGIESRVGEGSTFWFTAAFETPPEAPAPTSEAAASRHEARILIVDDDPTNRAVALAQLEKLGYPADVATTGAEAVEALHGLRYDLVLMDSEMPVMDGYEATRRIRESGNSRIAIVGVSSHAGSGERSRCIRQGMNDVLAKPVDLRLLEEILTKWLPRSQAVEEPGHGPSADIFDPEAFLKRLMGDRQLAGTIMAGFLGDAPSQLNNLRKRVEEADRTGARLQAHTLGGSAAAVSAGRLRAVAREMERAAAAGQLDDVARLLPRAIEEFERLKDTLEHTGWLVL